jgi:hypothetical protein
MAGVGSAAIYGVLVLAPLRLDRHPPSAEFDLARALGEDAGGLARFAVTMAVLFGLYLLAVVAAARAEGHAVLALGLAAVLMGVLVPAHPWYSRDVYHYIASMRVLYQHGENPYLVPPNAISGDPLVALADWGWLPSPYGPVWLLLTALPAALGHGVQNGTAYLVVFKLMAAACALGSAWLAGATAETVRPGTRTLAVVLVSWNPLMVLHAAGDAHNDAVLLLFVCLSIFLAVRGHSVRAGLALAAGVLVKFMPVLLLPLLVSVSWRSGQRRQAALTVLALPVLGVLAYAPFWAGWRTLRPSLEEGAYFTTSPQAALAVLVAGSLPGETVSGALAAGSRLLFLPVLALALLRTYDRERLPAAAVWVILLWLGVASPWFMPWYATWPLVLVAMLPWQKPLLTLVLALTAGALLLPVVTAYLMPMSGQGQAWPLLHPFGAAVVWVPVVTAALFSWRYHRCRWRAWTEASASRSVAASRAPVAGDAGD